MELALLKDIGLSEREAKLYLALLDLGSTTIGPLVDKTEIPSSKIYEVLHRLEEKGLANHIVVKKQKRFQAADPQTILFQLEDRAATFKEHLETLKQRQRLAQEKQHASFYEGKQAVFTMLRSLIKAAPRGEEYRSFAFDDEHKEQDIAAFLASLALLRQEKGLKTMILARTDAKKTIQDALPAASREAMHLRYTPLRYPEGTITVGDVLVLVEWEGTPSAVKIRSRTFAENFKSFFDGLYTNAKP